MCWIGEAALATFLLSLAYFSLCPLVALLFLAHTRPCTKHTKIRRVLFPCFLALFFFSSVVLPHFKTLRGLFFRVSVSSGLRSVANVENQHASACMVLPYLSFFRYLCFLFPLNLQPARSFHFFGSSFLMFSHQQQHTEGIYFFLAFSSVGEPWRPVAVSGEDVGPGCCCSWL